MNFSKATTILLALVLVPLAEPVMADTESTALEEIMVTAQRREQSLQDVPFALTALGEAQIRAQGLDELADYMQFVPGMMYSVVTEGPRGGQNLIVRGISNTRIFSADSGSAAATTGYYIGEIPIQTVDPRLYDVNRIEVLKGPQGTLFGAASMGGTVRIIPNTPDSTATLAVAELDYGVTDGGGNNVSLNAMFNMPLIEDKLAARLVVMSRENDGYIDLRQPSIDDGIRLSGGTSSPASRVNHVIDGVNDESTRGVRLALGFTPNEKLSITPSIYYQNVEYGSGFDYDESLGEGLISERYQPQPKHTRFTLAAIESSYDFGSAEIVFNTSSYRRNYTEIEDTTTFIASIFDNLGNGEIPATSSLDGDIRTESTTYELRLQSSGEQQGFLKNFEWVTGLYYYEEERDFNLIWHAPGYNANATPGNEISGSDDNIFTQVASGDDDNFSLFFDISYHLSDQWTVAAGARRYDQTQITSRTNSGNLAGNPVDPQAEGLTSQETGWTPRFNISYRPTENYMFWAGASKGFRAGGGNGPVVTPVCIQAVEDLGLQGLTKQFDSDQIWNYEVGVRSSLLDDRLVVNASYYHIDWTDLQQGVFLGALGSSCTRVLAGNVGEATSEGIDLEFTFQATDGLTLSGTVSDNRARLGAPDPLTTVGEKGDVLQGVPDEMYSLSAQFDFPLSNNNEGWARVDWSYTGERSSVLGWTDNPVDRQDEFSVTNLRFGVNSESWSAQLYVENVTNEHPEMSSIPKLGEESFTRLVGTLRPRTVGISVSRSFY